MKSRTVTTPERLSFVLTEMVKDMVDQQALDTFFDRAAPAIRDQLGRDLLAGRRPDGTPQTPLRHPRPSGSPGVPLVVEQTLYRSLALEAAPGHVERRGSNSLVIGTNLPKAALLNYGGTVRAGAKKLTVPVTAEAAQQSAREFPAVLHVVVRRLQAVALADKSGKVQYVLLDEIRYAGRQFVGWGERLIGRLTSLLRETVIERFRGR